MKTIKLLPPKLEGGKPFMQVVKERKSSREFSSKELPLQIISELLWAANGINRPESSHCTAPSAMNTQGIDIYLSKADGLYLFDPQRFAIILIVNQDIRAMTGVQPFVKDAPLNLIFTADHAKMQKTGSDIDFYSAADVGFTSENVYLYCAFAGLATVVRGSIDRPALAKAMKLRSEQKIILAQSVGYLKYTQGAVKQ